MIRIAGWWSLARGLRLRITRGSLRGIWILPLLVASPCGQSAGERASAQLQSALPFEMARLRDGSNGKDWLIDHLELRAPGATEPSVLTSERLPSASASLIEAGSPSAKVLDTFCSACCTPCSSARAAFGCTWVSGLGWALARAAA